MMPEKFNLLPSNDDDTDEETPTSSHPSTNDLSSGDNHSTVSESRLLSIWRASCLSSSKSIGAVGVSPRG